MKVKVSLYTDEGKLLKEATMPVDSNFRWDFAPAILDGGKLCTELAVMLAPKFLDHSTRYD